VTKRQLAPDSCTGFFAVPETVPPNGGQHKIKASSVRKSASDRREAWSDHAPRGMEGPGEKYKSFTRLGPTVWSPPFVKHDLWVTRMSAIAFPVWSHAASGALRINALEGRHLVIA